MDTLTCPACAHALSTKRPSSDCRGPNPAPRPGELSLCVECFAPLRFCSGPSGLALEVLTRAQAEEHVSSFLRLILGGLDMVSETALPGDYLVWRWPWHVLPEAWIFLAHRNPSLALHAVRRDVIPTLTRLTAPSLAAVVAAIDARAAMSSAELCAVLNRHDLPQPMPVDGARPLGPGDFVVDLAEGGEYLYQGTGTFDLTRVGN